MFASRGARRLTTVLIGALTATFAIGSPALAAKHVTKDARGDAASMVFDSATGATITPLPDETGADITRTVAKHTNRRLIVKVHVREATARTAPMLVMEIRTRKGRYEAAYIRGAGSHGFDLSTGAGKAVKCSGVKTSFSLDTDTATVSIPRSCIGSPPWVRLQVVTLGVNDTQNLIADDAQRTGMRSDGRLATGPRIRKG